MRNRHATGKNILEMRKNIQKRFKNKFKHFKSLTAQVIEHFGDRSEN
jgi:hypothetical protein